MKAFVDAERCKMCGLCIANCSKHAIEATNRLNAKGYKYVSVAQALCVGCGICYTVCPDGVFTIKEE